VLAKPDRIECLDRAGPRLIGVDTADRQAELDVFASRQERDERSRTWSTIPIRLARNRASASRSSVAEVDAKSS
jgi:hypothetical protein